MSISVTKTSKLSVGVPAIVTGVPEIVAKTAYSAPTGIGAIASKIVSIYADQAGDARTLSLGSTSAGAYYGTSTAANQLEVSVASSGAAAITVASGVLTLDASSVSIPSNLVIGTATITEHISGAATFTLPATGGEIIISAGAQTITGTKTIQNNEIANTKLLFASGVGVVGGNAGEIYYDSSNIMNIYGEYLTLDVDEGTDIYGKVIQLLVRTPGTAGNKIVSNGDHQFMQHLYFGAPNGANYTRVIASGVSGQNTITFPDVTGNVILSAGTQSIGGAKTFTQTLNTTDRINIIGSDLTVNGDIRASGGFLEFNSTQDLYFSCASVGQIAQFDCNIDLPSVTSSIKIADIKIGRVAPLIPGLHVINLPEISGEFVITAGTQSIGGAKTFTGTVVVPTPTSATHAATKGYVDAFTQGLDFHVAVRVTSTANVPLTGSVPLTVDGIVLVAGNRVLLKNQTAGAENGIYTLSIAGTYTLARSTDADDNTKLNNGTYTFTEEGTANGGFSFVCTTVDPIVLNTTPLTFVIFSESQTYSAGNGLVLSAAQFAVASTISTTNFTASGVISTNTINPYTALGPVTVSSSLIAATINATGATALGNVSSATTITGSAITLTGPTVANDQLRIAEDSAQLVLGVSASNNLVLSAATSGFAAQKTYTVPITTATTATVAVIEGAAPAAASGYVLVNSGTSGLAQWMQSTIQPSVTATLTTTAITVADLITIATTTGRAYLMEITVVAKIASGDMATYKIHVPVKNISGVVTVGSETMNNTSYDITFNGLEVGYVVSGTNFKVRTTPAVATSTNWHVYVTYTYVD